jgi:hypothetical protein
MAEFLEAMVLSTRLPKGLTDGCGNPSFSAATEGKSREWQSVLKEKLP